MQLRDETLWSCLRRLHYGRAGLLRRLAPSQRIPAANGKAVGLLGIGPPKITHQREETYCHDHEVTDDCCPRCGTTTKFDAVPPKIQGGDGHHQN